MAYRAAVRHVAYGNYLNERYPASVVLRTAHGIAVSPGEGEETNIMANINLKDIKLSTEDMSRVRGGRGWGKSTPILMVNAGGDGSTSIGSSTGGAGGAGKVKFDRLG